MELGLKLYPQHYQKVLIIPTTHVHLLGANGAIYLAFLAQKWQESGMHEFQYLLKDQAEDTGFTIPEIKKLRKKLKDIGCLHTIRRGVPAKEFIYLK